jgi:hypothetical protein
MIAMELSPLCLGNDTASLTVAWAPTKDSGVDPIGDCRERHHQEHHDQDHRDCAGGVVLRRIAVQAIAQSLRRDQKLAEDDAD